MVQVCVGDQLELTCIIEGTLLEWSVPRISMTQTQLPWFTRAINSQDSADTQTFQFVDNSITYIFSRTSAPNSPVSSTLLISVISDEHNGTVVTCMDVATSESSSTIILVTDNQIQGVCTNYPLILK